MIPLKDTLIDFMGIKKASEIICLISVEYNYFSTQGERDDPIQKITCCTFSDDSNIPDIVNSRNIE